jgi:hypothetical protein
MTDEEFIDILKAALLKRFGTTTAGEEKAFEYLDKVLDRQINKANGLLALNSILFTAFTLSNISGWAVIPGSWSTLGSSAMLLNLLWFRTGNAHRYEKPSDEIDDICSTIFRWKRNINIAIRLSAFSMAIAAIGVCFRHS